MLYSVVTFSSRLNVFLAPLPLISSRFFSSNPHSPIKYAKVYVFHTLLSKTQCFLFIYLFLRFHWFFFFKSSAHNCYQDHWTRNGCPCWKWATLLPSKGEPWDGGYGEKLKLWFSPSLRVGNTTKASLRPHPTLEHLHGHFLQVPEESN